MKKWQIIGFLAILILGFVLTSGCTNASRSTPTKEIVYVTVLVTPSTIPTIAHPPTISPFQTVVPSSINVRSTGNPGWLKYTSYSDRFSIYKPSDWTVKEMDTSELMKGDTSGLKFLDKFVYIFTPNMKGFIMIYGADFSGTLYSIFNDPGKTQISDEFYDGFVTGVKSGETDQMKIISMVKDSNYYQINGNPARKVTVNTLINGEPLSGDFYLIAHENLYYVEGFFAMEGSTPYDASTATNIMRTFATTT